MDGIRDAYTTKDLVNLLGVAQQNVHLRAKRESWSSRERAGRGGGKEWLVASMPETTRLVIAAKVCPAPAPEPVTPQCQHGLAKAAELRGSAKTRAEAKLAVFTHYKLFTATAGLPRLRGLDAFMRHWNAREIAAEDWIYEAVPKVCRNTLLNWERTVTTKGVAALSGRYGTHRELSGVIDTQPEVRELILGMIKTNPTVSGRLLMDGLKTLNTERLKSGKDALQLPSERRLQDWVADWKRENAQLYQHLTAPDQWRSRFMASCGDMYELVTAYNQRWEYDGTPADLLLADGHRYTIVGVINIYSRELMLEVAETSSARVVGNLTRRAILEWGVPEEAVTDNGKEFVASYMQTIFSGLDITPTVLPPFRPDLKPGIERVFKTFSHHLLTIMPGYAGHNVAERQAIRERETFAKRLFTKGAEIEIRKTPDELQAFCDAWCNDVYRHQEHRGLKGKTPWEVRQAWKGEIRLVSNVRALDVLLTELADGQDGWRDVGKKGVRADGLFDHPALGSLRGKRVQVRFAGKDRSAAYIFDESGEFVCLAKNILNVSSEERRDIAMGTRRAQKAFVNAGEKEMRRMAERSDAEGIAERIMAASADRARRIEAETATQQAETSHTTPMLEQCAIAAQAGIVPAPKEHGSAIDELRERTRQQLETSANRPVWAAMTPNERFALWESYNEAVEKGETLTPEQEHWRAKSYPASAECIGKRMALNMRFEPMAAAG